MKNLGFKTKPIIFSLIAVCAAALISWRVADPLRTAQERPDCDRA
jgi:hypothetical protein